MYILRNLQLETVISNRYDYLYRAQSNSTVTLRLIYVILTYCCHSQSMNYCYSMTLIYQQCRRLEKMFQIVKSITTNLLNYFICFNNCIRPT